MKTEYLLPGFGKGILSRKEFKFLSQYIHSELGIEMPIHKKVLLESRLQKRLRALNFSNFSEYINFLFSTEGKAEMPVFINRITTHETYFFREEQHFNYLLNTILPDLFIKSNNFNLNVWSAACSTGEEVYTLGMTIEDFKSMHQNIDFSYSILATDVAIESATKAKKGIYNNEALKKVPKHKVQKYFLKNADPRIKTSKMVKELRNHIRFGILNLNDSFQLEEKMDIIFCRNVLIYFDKNARIKTLRNICNQLKKGGHLFIGLSENIHKLDIPLKKVSTSVFTKI